VGDVVATDRTFGCSCAAATVAMGIDGDDVPGMATEDDDGTLGPPARRATGKANDPRSGEMLALCPSIGEPTLELPSATCCVAREPSSLSTPESSRRQPP